MEGETTVMRQQARAEHERSRDASRKDNAASDGRDVADAPANEQTSFECYAIDNGCRLLRRFGEGLSGMCVRA